MKKLLFVVVALLGLTSCDLIVERATERVNQKIDSVVNNTVNKADSIIYTKADSAIRSF